MTSDVLSNMGSEEVVPHIDVFGSRTILWVVGNLNGTAVVLENTAMDLGLGVKDGKATLLHFLKNPNNSKASCKARDMPTYSALVVESAMMDCSWEAHRSGIPQWNRT